MLDEQLYLRLDNGLLLNLFWSDNDPADSKTATAVLSINLYQADGCEFDGGELDVQDEDPEIRNYIQDALDFMDLFEVKSYEDITEEEFSKLVD